MSSQQHKEQALKVRIDGRTAGLVTLIANELHVSPSSLARALLEEFVQAHTTHCALLAWPPRFAFYESPPTGTATKSPTQQTTYDDDEPRTPKIAADPRPGRKT